MPIVTIQVPRKGAKPGTTSLTAEERAALIEGTSLVLLDVLNEPLESTFVIIEEVDVDSSAQGVLPVLGHTTEK
jgi:4-oxalocrotonate tautomerase